MSVIEICKSETIIGRVGSEARPDYVEIVSKYPIPRGTYISIPLLAEDHIYSGGKTEHCFIGVIGSTSYRRAVRVVPLYPESESASIATAVGVDEGSLRYSPSVATIFADVVGDRIVTPSIPPQPDIPVYLASSSILRRVFSGSSSGVRIGHLLGRPDVDVYIDVDALTKHLFITGTTGSGKSNTVAVLADRIASIGGIVAIYDVHGEYTTLQPENSFVEVKTVDYMLNPLKIEPKVLARIIVPEAAATVQRSLVSRAIETVSKHFRDVIARYGVSRDTLEFIGKNLGECRTIKIHEDEEELNRDIDVEERLLYIFKECVKNVVRKYGGNSEAVEKACGKVDEFFEYASLSFSIDRVVDMLKPSRILVINASLLSEEQRDYSLKIILDEMLWFVKQRMQMNSPLPVLFFIEEAHLFLSTARNTVSRTSIERVAREGRKFGLSLAIVSQRPRMIDPSTVSQIQNYIFMKLVQEQDQSVVMNISDMLTESLARSLSSMDVGEALLLGEFIGRFPAYVKIDEHRGKKVGASLKISSIWRSMKERQKSRAEVAEIVREGIEDLKDLL